MHIAHVATKTISLKEEAYNRLRAARRYPSESFSEVVVRATWPEDTTTARSLLAAYRAGRPHLTAKELDRIDALKQHDAAPEDKWAGR